MQGVNEKYGITLGTSSTYQNKKEVHISMCSEKVEDGSIMLFRKVGAHLPD
jgi:hypothetical protein